jgi:2-polyprenyl-6-methoxyphenol hydroxylase-like FAD-dependent oxidoreductase
MPARRPVDERTLVPERRDGSRVVVVGGGIGGLGTALALARAGIPVTVLERDPLPHAGGPEEAFRTARRGAPQVRQTHAFLARMRLLLRERFPDVLADLLAEGCYTLPTTTDLGEPQPGDDDLQVLVVRRTTFEWVLRRAVAAEPLVELRPARAVTGLVTDPGDPPLVTGVRLTDGVVPAATVVVATGRRDALVAWLAEHGVILREEQHDSGLVYLTRWYRLPPGFDTASLDPKLGGDLGFVKYLAVPGDGATLSVTLAVPAADRALRRALGHPARFELACRLLPGPSQFFADGGLEPIGGVRPMGGLCNRTRRFLDGSGRPVVVGLHAVGDAHTCTNPLYGRGCTLAMVQAVHLADAMAAHPDDPLERACAYEAAWARDVLPWYQVSLQMDRMGADPAGRPGGPAGPLVALFVAARTDPILGRGLARFIHLLATPAELAADPTYAARAAAVMADPSAYPPPPREGPDREALLAALETPDTKESACA